MKSEGVPLCDENSPAGGALWVRWWSHVESLLWTSEDFCGLGPFVGRPNHQRLFLWFHAGLMRRVASAS